MKNPPKTDRNKKIYSEYTGGARLVDLSRKYGISSTRIAGICHQIQWKIDYDLERCLQKPRRSCLLYSHNDPTGLTYRQKMQKQ